jgi:hypothetical protein
MEATARVIPLSGKPQQAKVATAGELAPVSSSPAVVGPQLGALDGVIVRMPDEQLEALGTIFCASPLRRVMTFEGYLVARGFGYGIEQ